MDSNENNKINLIVLNLNSTRQWTHPNYSFMSQSLTGDYMG